MSWSAYSLASPRSGRDQPPKRRWRSAAEAAMALTVVAEGAEEVDLAQVGSERLDEVELAVRALPQHEVGEALLPRGADHEVGVRLPAGVQVLGDELGGEQRGQVLDRAALQVMRLDDAPHGVRDLGAAAVADREVDVQSCLARSPLLRLGEPRHERIGEPGRRADVLHAPV